MWQLVGDFKGNINTYLIWIESNGIQFPATALSILLTEKAQYTAVG